MRLISLVLILAVAWFCFQAKVDLDLFGTSGPEMAVKALKFSSSDNQKFTIAESTVACVLCVIALLTAFLAPPRRMVSPRECEVCLSVPDEQFPPLHWHRPPPLA